MAHLLRDEPLGMGRHGHLDERPQGGYSKGLFTDVLLQRPNGPISFSPGHRPGFWDLNPNRCGLKGRATVRDRRKERPPTVSATPTPETVTFSPLPC